MKKDEIKRLIVSIILFVLSTLCAVLGIIKYYDGYGKYGKIRKELMPIINNFNESKVIKRNDSIWADFNNNSIKIYYVDKVTNLKYDFLYNENNGIKYLSLNYNSSDKQYVEKIITELIEAISINNGNKYGDIINSYNLDNFNTTTLNDGIQITNNGTTTNIKIAININFVDSLKNIN